MDKIFARLQEALHLLTVSIMCAEIAMDISQYSENDAWQYTSMYHNHMHKLSSVVDTLKCADIMGFVNETKKGELNNESYYS